MPRLIEPFSVKQIEALKPRTGLYNLGGVQGLYLSVRRSDAKFFIFKYQSPASGKSRNMGLGPFCGPNRISLAEAREKARVLRAVLRQGLDPLDERDRAKAEKRAAAQAQAIAGVSFGEVAKGYLRAHAASWSHKHHKQSMSTLETYSMPVFGAVPVAAIETAHIMQVLAPLWGRAPQTASRLRGRLEAVLDYAKSAGYRQGDNPARWRGHLENLLVKASKAKPVKHHEALEWRQAGQFMQALRQQDAIGARALEFCILTAARAGEVRGMVWGEVDLDASVWTVPASRMKARREHRVPLSPAANAVLRRQAEVCPRNKLVFPGPRGGRLSQYFMTNAIRRAGEPDAVTHGFRSTFRDWAGEHTAFAREICEAALAHTVGGLVERAYSRGDLFEKRRKLMEAWATYCARPADFGTVIPLHAIGV
jgi:integrase